MNPPHVAVLCRDVFFVAGARRGAIYDLRDGAVYSVNQAACQILTYHREHLGYWKKLVGLGVAEWRRDAPVQVKSLVALPYSPPRLEFVWFEIAGERCNERCLHCYANGETNRGSGHREASPRARMLGHAEWTRLIEDCYNLGCRKCQFIGGEPFLYSGADGRTVLDLARHARETGYDFIEIFTNGTLLTPSMLEKIKALDINIAVSIYSHMPRVHDAITRTPGSFMRTMKALARLRRLSIQTRVAVVLMLQNQVTIERTREQLRTLGIGDIQVDVVRPTGRGRNALPPQEEIYRRYAVRRQPDFRADRKAVSRAVHGNSCLNGKLAITEEGEVLPCVFGRDWAVGNTRRAPLAHIVRDAQLQKLWAFSKDSVMVCGDCEYRYVCPDCRPLANAASRKLEGPPPRCAYDPFRGEWGTGEWHLGIDGRPVYASARSETQ
jgi:radical SAM protein with 4Fe4S-binding SPASM domain